MDDLFGFGEPSEPSLPRVEPVETSAPQYLSRRALREAEARASVAAPAQPVAAPAIPGADVERPVADVLPLGLIPSEPVRSEATRSAATRSATARVVPSTVVALAARPARAAARMQKALQRSSGPATPRKNPLSVLATMGVVGGLFAVAGLPAYAFTTPETTTAAVSDAGAQSITVSAGAAATITARDTFKATTPEQLAQQQKDALRAAANAAYLASGARELGDDYPWAYELTDDQGGGLSPLNYYYRECVDFVAWRLNRDAGSYAAPFKWVWSNLTPLGGNGGQWMYNWQAHGWPVSSTPIAGAVAYTGGNHVAYVKSVNSDGTVLLEEYNYIPGVYSQRTIPASSVVAFLYPPPS